MAKSNWAENFSNEERIVFQKGNWTLTEDGEKTWSLYCLSECVNPVVDFNKYILFNNGFLLFRENSNINSYALYLEDCNHPIFTMSGKDTSVKKENGLIIFKTSNQNETAFDAETLMKVHLAADDQLGFDL